MIKLSDLPKIGELASRRAAIMGRENAIGSAASVLIEGLDGQPVLEFASGDAEIVAAMLSAASNGLLAQRADMERQLTEFGIDVNA